VGSEGESKEESRGIKIEGFPRGVGGGDSERERERGLTGQ
jgi:hypothetical protein